ncbi:hypothetical protein Ocin01_05065 [Orchesella cincta]|uniref:Uncharacterized protein n=1 Tax=Orchesella cincta TaxID=48709 RepID=A0A1D2N920_ORCCI|nr:hypothetical protein Ocin01_05065 [Orchesella cincta]
MTHTNTKRFDRKLKTFLIGSVFAQYQHQGANFSEKMDKQQQAAQGNRTNQCNPNHQPTGAGRSSGYQGAGTRSDLNNRSNQMNPNSTKYGGGSGSGKK